MKKYSLISLAKALAELSSEKMSADKESKAIDGFIRILQQHGMLSKSDKIINLAKDYLLQKKGNNVAVIKTSRPINDSQKKLATSFLKSGDKISYETDPNLIAGMKITINDEKQLDFSLRRKIEETFLPR